MFWRACLCIAFVLFGAVLFSITASWVRKTWSSKIRFYLLALGVYLFVFILLLPYYWNEKIPEISKIILSLHSAAQAFTFDISALDIAEGIAAEGNGGAFFAWYTRILSVAVMICPIFTIGFFLSFIRDFRSYVRLGFHFRKKAIIFSELNEMSLSVAETASENRKVLIIFADAYVNEDGNAELIEQAKKLHAVLFRKDVTHLPLRKMACRNKCGKKKTVPRRHARELLFILLSSDQSKALSQGLELESKYRSRPNATATVYSASSAAGIVIDSKANPAASLSKSFIDSVNANPELLWDSEAWKQNAIDHSAGFYLRRFDPIRQFVQNTLTNDTLLDAIKTAAEKDHVVSLTIIGYGEIGSVIIKNAVWMYQRIGSRVEINVFDKRGKKETEDIFRQECPELCEEHGVDGDAAYSIRFFTEKDVFSTAFSELFAGDDDTAARLRKTQVVFTTLGDDDKNIAAALRVRVMYDQMLSLTGEDYKNHDSRTFSPMIFSVVYDEGKYGNLQGNAAEQPNLPWGSLKSCKGENYYISFIGNLSSIYSIDALREYDAWERDAVIVHIDWMQIAHLIKRRFHSDKSKSFKERILKMYRAKYLNEHSNDQELESIVKRDIDDLCFEELYRTGSDELVDNWADVLSREFRNYYHYEYFRSSSIAKFLYNKQLSVFHEKAHMTESDRRKQEHMRWNAFMRSFGYCKGVKFYRGRMHHDIVPFDDLRPIEQLKD